jgi:hypothetical protein
MPDQYWTNLLSDMLTSLPSAGRMSIPADHITEHDDRRFRLIGLTSAIINERNS